MKASILPSPQDSTSSSDWSTWYDSTGLVDEIGFNLRTMSAENEQQKQESLVEIPILVPQSTQENGQENTTESTTDIKLEFQDLEYNSTTQKDPIDLPNGTELSVILIL